MNKLLLLLLICYHIIKFFSAILSVQFLGQEIIGPDAYKPICIQLFRERLLEKMCTRQSRKVIMGYDWYTIPDDCSCRTYFCCFPLALANTFSWPFVPILLNFFKEQWTQNHPQCLSGLLRALIPTTFLQIAV